MSIYNIDSHKNICNLLLNIYIKYKFIYDLVWEYTEDIE